jgi:hypothetical protein
VSRKWLKLKGKRKKLKENKPFPGGLFKYRGYFFLSTTSNLSKRIKNEPRPWVWERMAVE